MNIATRAVSAAVLGLTLAASPAMAQASAGPTQSTQAQAARTATPAPVPAVSGTATPLGLSHNEVAEWKRLVATAAGREHVVADLQAAFHGIATVGTGSSATPRAGAQPNLATGITGDHFWIIASYADIADGAIWAGVRACQAKLPAWLCTSAGNLLTSWAAGWGAANDHGVWAAIYWWPPRITGGRW